MSTNQQLQAALFAAHAERAKWQRRATAALARLDRIEHGAVCVRGTTAITQDMVDAYVEAMRPTCSFTADQVLAWYATSH